MKRIMRIIPTDLSVLSDPHWKTNTNDDDVHKSNNPYDVTELSDHDSIKKNDKYTKLINNDNISDNNYLSTSKTRSDGSDKSDTFSSSYLTNAIIVIMNFPQNKRQLIILVIIILVKQQYLTKVWSYLKIIVNRVILKRSR